MTDTAFDTLDFATELQQAGVAPELAQAQARALARALQHRFEPLATHAQVDAATGLLRADLALVENKLQGEIQQFATELHGEIRQVENKLRGEIQQLATELRGEIREVENKLRGEIQQLATELRAEMRSRFVLLEWMVGVTLAGVGAIALKLLL